jgi:hypothetical protein
MIPVQRMYGDEMFKSTILTVESYLYLQLSDSLFLFYNYLERAVCMFNLPFI